MKITISEKIKLAIIFTGSMIFALIFTASTLSYIAEKYGEKTQRDGLNKSEIAIREMPTKNTSFVATMPPNYK